MAERKSKQTGSDAGRMTKRSRLRGWLIIAAVAIAIMVFFVLGTMDSRLRYDLIGL